MSTPKKILCIDVEATCWKDLLPSIGTSKNEIIEIGITPIDIKTQQLEDSFAIIVIPPTTNISKFCTELTTLTPEFVAEKGIPFEDAMKILLEKFKSDRNIFASWGDYDRRSFEKNCGWNNVKNPISNLNINVKALYAAMKGYTGGLARIAEDMQIPFEGTHHRGVDDSRVVAKILQKLLYT